MAQISQRDPLHILSGEVIHGRGIGKLVDMLFGIEQTISWLYMNAAKRQVIIGDQEVYLSAKEFEVLYMLYSNPDIAYTKKQIYETVWHEPSNGCCHAVENTVFQIRKRLKDYSGEHDFIKTIIGFGYKFNTGRQ